MDCIRPLIYPPYPPTPLHCESASTSSSMASITAMWTTTAIPISYKPKSPPPSLSSGEGRGGLTVVCSSRPQKKSTAHHMKTRPKKSQPWDIKRRGPTPYPPLPSLPPDWTLLSSSSEETTQVEGGEEVSATAPA